MVERIKKARLIYNPTSGQEIIKKNIAEVLDVLDVYKRQHLESFQQFLIDYKLKVDDKEYEVTPFLNSRYHSKETFAFSNVFNQVKAGKTSDAETMIETGLFGLNQGSFMVNYGGTLSLIHIYLQLVEPLDRCAQLLPKRESSHG